MEAKCIGITKISDEEAKKGVDLLKKIFLPQQEEWERNGIDAGRFSPGSFIRQDIEVVGETDWLKQRWEFLENYFRTPKSKRRVMDLAMVVAVKIFESQGKNVPEPVYYGKLKEHFKDRFDWKEISLALDFLVDGLFIKYYCGNIDTKRATNGLIKFMEEIPEEMRIS